MIRKIFVLAVLLVLPFTHGLGQQPSAKVDAQVVGAPPQATASSPGLQELIREALQKNPGVQGAARQVEAMRRRVPQAKTLPDPTISVGWAGNIVPFQVQKLDPSSYRGIAASQALPYPGKLKLRGQIADREAQAASWDYEAARRQLVADVKTAYYDYFYSSKAIEVTLQNKDLLQKLAKIAEARYRVGKGLQPDVLRAQVEISRIQQRLTVLQQQQRSAQVRLNTLLLREPEAPLPAPGTIERANLDYSLEQLYELAHKNDTGLEREEQVIERNQYAVNLAQKDYYPDFTVAYLYQQRPVLPDMHGFTVTANIPIFYKTKQREAVQEATEQLAGAQQGKANRETELNFAVKEQYLAAKSSDELMRLYSNAIVPQSSLALESSMAAYEVGTVDFLTILSNFTAVLDYEVEYYQELANYNKALARLEPLVGVQLTK